MREAPTVEEPFSETGFAKIGVVRPKAEPFAVTRDGDDAAVGPIADEEGVAIFFGKRGARSVNEIAPAFLRYMLADELLRLVLVLLVGAVRSSSRRRASLFSKSSTSRRKSAAPEEGSSG